MCASLNKNYKKMRQAFMSFDALTSTVCGSRICKLNKEVMKYV